ncbi:MAG: hypothetical protein PHC98_00160 [Syntrophotalea acetylenica]|nr:hypothetical protein [Syntrophotalea acetylenica]
MADETDTKWPRIPRLYETEGTAAEGKLIHLHFHFHESHWYVAEFDGDDTFFGFVILEGDMQNAEWGYFTWSELVEIQYGDMGVEIDMGWVPTRFSEIKLGTVAKWEPK